MDWNLGLNFYSSKAILFNPSDLETEKTTKELIASDKYHIYLICKRKKMFFESTNPLDENSYVSLYYSLDDKHSKVHHKIQHTKEIKINSYSKNYYNIDFKEYPNLEIRDFILINNFYFLENDLIGGSITSPLPSDLEVMYVGQAYGRTENRKIDYRLANHEKLQQIALKILDEGSNEEVLIIGLKVEVGDLGTSIISDITNMEVPQLTDLLTLRDNASQRIPEAQEVTIFEASLITYFRPKYNKEYLETFPSPDFRSYEEIYHTKFDYISMAIDTRPIGVRVFSENIKERRYIHGQYNRITSNADKVSLLENLMRFPA
jgi:hypothetical protein